MQSQTSLHYEQHNYIVPPTIHKQFNPFIPVKNKFEVSIQFHLFA